MAAAGLAVPAAAAHPNPSEEAPLPQSGNGAPPGQTEEQQRVLFSGALAEEVYAQEGIAHRWEFITNSRGMRLFTQTWVPAKQKPRALICCCHGFGNDTSWMFQLNCIRFAASGYAVCAMEYEGHGRSDGLKAAFRDSTLVAQDCIQYFTSIRSREEFKDLPALLLGESMGGAFALLLLSLTNGLGGQGSRAGEELSVSGNENGDGNAPSGGSNELGTDGEDTPSLSWNGLILISPMLRISDEMRPHWLIITLLQGLAYFIPDAAIVPTPETIRMSCRDPERLKLALANPLRYAGKPRLGTSVELLKLTDKSTEVMPEVALPFLVVHGECDVVTDCSSSKTLYAVAPSADKTLKLYPGGGHQLLQGEADDFREKVWKDVLEWVHAHTAPTKQ